MEEKDRKGMLQVNVAGAAEVTRAHTHTHTNRNTHYLDYYLESSSLSLTFHTCVAQIGRLNYLNECTLGFAL